MPWTACVVPVPITSPLSSAVDLEAGLGQPFAMAVARARAARRPAPGLALGGGERVVRFGRAAR